MSFLYWIQVRSLPCLVSQSVTPSSSWDLIDVTMACEDHATSPCVANRLPCGCFAVVMLLLHFCYAVAMLLPVAKPNQVRACTWAVSVLSMNCQRFYMDLSTFLQGFVKFVTWICQNCYICIFRPLPKKKQSWSLTQPRWLALRTECLGSVVPLAIFIITFSMNLSYFWKLHINFLYCTSISSYLFGT